MFVLSVLEAPNTKTNSLCVQTHLAIKFFLILILILILICLLAGTLVFLFVYEMAIILGRRQNPSE